MQAHAPEGSVKKGTPETDLLVGITSYGEGKCGSGIPAVYTNIGYFIDWIQNKIKGKNEKVRFNSQS